MKKISTKVAETCSPLQAFRYLAKTIDGSRLQVLNALNPVMFPTDADDDEVLEDDNDELPFEHHHNYVVLKKDQVRRCVHNVKMLAAYWQLSIIEALTLTIIMIRDINNRSSCDMNDLCGLLDIGAIDAIPFRKTFESLESKGYVTSEESYHGRDYKATDQVIDLTFSGSDFKVPDHKSFDRYMFCGKVSRYIHRRHEGDICTTDLADKVEKLERSHSDLEFVKSVTSLIDDTVDRTFFYEMCNNVAESPFAYTHIEVAASDIFDNPSARYRYCNSLIREANKLFKQNLVVLKPAEMANGSRIGLSERGRKIFFAEDADLFIKDDKQGSSVIATADIKPVKLFYSDEFNSTVNPLRIALTEESFKNLQERLEEKHMPKGVAAIFYGAPGTGKTELVKQIARETGRDIMHVDISQTKSCWVGESEKLVKEIFNRYRRLCKESKVKPILLFNEADAVFSKRMDPSASHNSSVVQMMNAMQNIILEEMESLDGILIATTNLQTTLDDAFERRFLYKVKFPKPSTDVKQKIWMDKMHSLSESDARTLAVRYDFSGGEIDNIVRKSVLEEVVTGEKSDFDRVCKFCDAEKFSNDRERKIGY